MNQRKSVDDPINSTELILPKSPIIFRLANLSHSGQKNVGSAVPKKG